MEIKEVVPALAALAHENRLQLFRLLVEAGTEGIAVGQIAEQLALPIAAPVVSHGTAPSCRAGGDAARRAVADICHQRSAHERLDRFSHRELLRREDLRTNLRSAAHAHQSPQAGGKLAMTKTERQGYP